MRYNEITNRPTFFPCREKRCLLALLTYNWQFRNIECYLLNTFAFFMMQNWKTDLNDKHSHFVNAFIFVQQAASLLSLILVNRKIKPFCSKNMLRRCIKFLLHNYSFDKNTNIFKRVGVFCRIQTNESLWWGLFVL